MSTVSLTRLRYPGVSAGEHATWQLLKSYPVVLVLIFLAAHGTFSFLGARADFGVAAPDTSFTHHVVIALAWAAGILLMLPQVRRLAQAALHAWLLLLFPLFAMLSTLWSQDASSTAHNAFYLALTTLFAIYLAEQFSPLQQMQFVLMTGVACTVAGFALAWFRPFSGLDQVADTGALQGIFVGKNVCALASLFFLTPLFSLPSASLVSRTLRTLYGASLLAAIALTRSRTGAALAVVYLVFSGAVCLLGKLRRRQVAGILFASLLPALAAAWLLLAHFTPILEWMGRDATLHGRTAIWRAMLVSLARHPWIGYGYGAFWLGLRGESMNIFPRVHWVMGYAHDGYLEVCSQLGVAGLAILGALLVRACFDAWICFRRERPRYVDWYIGIVFLTLVYNLDEAFLGAFHQLPWVLFLVAALGLRKRVLELRKPQPAPIVAMPPPLSFQPLSADRNPLPARALPFL